MKRKQYNANQQPQGQKFFKTSTFEQVNREINIGNLALSQAINDQKHYETAINHYEQALKLIDRLTEPEQTNILISVTTPLTNLNSSLEKNIHEHTELYANMKYRLGVMYQKLNREKALQYFNAAVPYFKKCDTTKYAEIETHLANICHHKGKIADMIIHCNNAAPILKTSYPEAYQKMLKAICQELNKHDKDSKIWDSIEDDARNLSKNIARENGKFIACKLPTFSELISSLQAYPEQPKI